MTKYCSYAVVGFVLLVALSWFLVANFTYKVDAGKVGLLINYTQKEKNGSPHVTVIPQSSFIWYNSWNSQAVFEYPLALQTLTLVANAQEGQQQGDDSVTFVTQNGIPLKIDVTVQWRVTNPAQLYFLMPGVPLDGDFNHDVSTKLVRQSVIHALNQSGSAYQWQEVSSHEDLIEKNMAMELYPLLDKYGITVEQIALGQPHYSRQQQAAIDNVARAQQETQQAQFLKQKAEYEAQANQITAQSQAQQIRVINEQLEKSPDYLKYLQVKEWDGHLPATLVNGNN